ncbi:MAG: F0F1 ATP synthase subunit B [Gemmatimonadaceae bacterium]|nr:F0F1 ATP synthase subunit B [Gemmatimonadaceae bacterium]
MRHSSLLVALMFAAAPLHAQEHAATPGLMSPNTGLMFWTVLIFVALFLVLRKFAFPVILASVEAREKALENALSSAKRDREAAALLLAEHRANLDASRAEGQKLIADARAAAERVRAELVEQAHAEQQKMLERARAEISSERTKAIAELRREAVDLAILGAGKVIGQNLDRDANRKLVESFLASVTTSAVTASR